MYNGLGFIEYTTINQGAVVVVEESESKVIGVMNTGDGI